MSIHHLKINRQPFEDLVSGRKTGEVRNCSDRDFKVGDSVELFMTETESGRATESIVRTITHIQRGYGLPDDICVLSYANHNEEPLGVVEPAVQVAAMPVERCYDVRVKMIMAFNEAKKNGGDLDDSLDAAYKSALRFSPNPLIASPPAPVAVVLPERKHYENKTSTRDYVMNCGWNACLDKVKELNQ